MYRIGSRVKTCEQIWSARSAQRVYQSVCRYLTVVLRLVVNQEKSRVVETDGLALLLW